MDDNFSLLDDSFEDVLCSSYDIQIRSPFRLPDLPPELWLRICELAVQKHGPIQFGREPDPRDQMAIVAQPGITQACRALRCEGLPLFYSTNTFELYHCFGVPCPRQWILAIGEVNRQRMRTLTVVSGCQKNFWEGSFQRSAIDVEVEYDGPAQRVAALIFHGGLNKYKVNFIARRLESCTISTTTK